MELTKKLRPLLCLASLFLLGLSGCSRSVEDIARWEKQHQVEKLAAALADPNDEVRKAAVISLGKLKAESAVEALTVRLNDPNESIQLATINALAGIGSPAAGTSLAEALVRGNTEVRIRAINALETLKPAEAIDSLAKALNDANEEVQHAATEALSAIGSPGTVPPLISALKLKRAETRIVAVKALATLKEASALGALIETLNDGHESVQLATCNAIGSLRDEAGFQPLAYKLTDQTSSTLVKTACIRALVKIDATQASKVFMETLTNSNSEICQAASAALLKIGDPAIPSIIEGLSHREKIVRNTSVDLLEKLNAIPTQGIARLWYQLARASREDTPEPEDDVISAMADMGEVAIPNLLDAASHPDPVIRKYGVLALDQIGESCIAAAQARVENQAIDDAKAWFAQRAQWHGAPSARLDQWGALAALNPEFTIDKVALQTLAGKGTGAKRLLDSKLFNITEAYIPLVIDLLDDKECGQSAQQRLAALDHHNAIPLIAAIQSSNRSIAEHAATMAAERADERAAHPLIEVLRAHVQKGEMLSNSPFYAALIKMNTPAAESILCKVRPNAKRAISLFEKQYGNAHVMFTQTMDPYRDNKSPVSFLLGYDQNGQRGSTEITFRKNSQGNWYPFPDLPKTLAELN